MRYFTSDPHWGHPKITIWARPQFKTIEEHDAFLVQKHLEWAEKLKPEDEFWCLGDLFKLDYLWVYDYFPCETHLVMGNHDYHKHIDRYKEHFTYVHEYPLYISDRICVSHIPQAVFPDQLNVCGHLHGNIIDKSNYISACLEVNNFNLVSEKQINSTLGRLPKYTRKHLEAPYTEDEKVIVRPQNDLILTPSNHIDISAMRALKKFEELNK